MQKIKIDEMTNLWSLRDVSSQSLPPVFRSEEPPLLEHPLIYQKLANLCKLTRVVCFMTDAETDINKEQAAVEAADLLFIHLPMDGFTGPTQLQIDICLSILNQESHTLIHCKNGWDRTGCISACLELQHGIDYFTVTAHAWDGGMKEWWMFFKQAHEYYERIKGNS